MFLAAACAELDSHSTFSRFQKSEDLYRASMRWGKWTNILQLIRPRPESSDSTNYNSKKMLMNVKSDSNYSSTGQESSTEQESSFEELLAHLDTIHVSNVEVLSSAIKAEGTGESRLLIQYRFDTSAKINSIRHTVSWWYDKQSNNWFTDTPLPKEFDLPKHRTIKLLPKRY